MAKAQGTKATNRSRKGATSRRDDAERLAALRWLVMRIEQLCIEVFVTDRRRFADLEGSLRAEVKRLQNMAPDKGLAGPPCPDGYILCRDGLCAPMCEDFDAIAAPSAGMKGGTRR